MNLGAPHWELASLGRGTTTTTKRVLFRCFRIRSSSIHATSSRASRAAAAAGVVALTRKWCTTPGTAGTATAAAAAVSEREGTAKKRPTRDTRWWCKRCRWRGRRKKRKRRWWITTNALRCRCCCRRRKNSLPILSSSPQPPQQPRLSQSSPSRSAVVRWSRGTSKGPANPGRSGRHLGDWSGIRTSGADIIEQRGYPGEWSLADRATGWTTTRIIVARVCPSPQRRGTRTKRETDTRGECSCRERRYVEARSPVQEGVDVYRCTVEREGEENLARVIEWRKNISDISPREHSEAESPSRYAALLASCLSKRTGNNGSSCRNNVAGRVANGVPGARRVECRGTERVPRGGPQIWWQRCGASCSSPAAIRIIYATSLPRVIFFVVDRRARYRGEGGSGSEKIGRFWWRKAKHVTSYGYERARQGTSTRRSATTTAGRRGR